MQRRVPYRPAVAELSRKAFEHNLKVIQSLAKKKSSLHQASSKIMAVVKANAYGHSVENIAKEARRYSINTFCVASIEEGVELRKILRSAKILVLGGSLHWTPQSIREVEEHQLEVGINDIHSFKKFLSRPQIKLHLKFDTGMNRLGIKSEDWSQVFEWLQKSKRKIEGIYTHYASFDEGGFKKQIMLFEEIVHWFSEKKKLPAWIHSENSAALFASKAGIKKGILSESANLIRPGIAMYGYLPSNFKTSKSKEASSLRPVLKLVSEIGLVKKISAGEGMSYDFLYKAKHDHEYGVVSLGYADGIAKSYGNSLRPDLIANGKKKATLQICGAICMDMVMVKAASARLNIGDKVVFWGEKENSLLKTKIADPYELNLRIAKRIPRIWV